MNGNNKNIIYTATDIEKYFSGDLSPMQMHAMEKAALDDPFLAEAMEGYEGMKDNQWIDQLVAVREQVAEKGSVAKVIPLHKRKYNWRKIAAAVILLGGGAVTTFIVTRNKPGDTNPQKVAQIISAGKDNSSPGSNKDKGSVSPVPESITSANATTKQDKKNVTGIIAPAEKNERSEHKSVPGTEFLQTKPEAQADIASNTTDEKVAQVSPSATNYANTPINKSGVARESVTFKDKQSSPAYNDPGNGIVSGKLKAEDAFVSKKDQPLNNFFTAQVVGPDNAPLPFTNITIKKENFGTYADIKGMLRLVSSDSLLNVELKSVGYLPKTVTLRSGQPQTKIVLQEDEEAMKENTVVINRESNNTKSRRATLVTDSAVNIEPSDGWDNYNTYVANNFDIPDEMLERDLHGEVELSFDVRSNGTISNIHVNKSPGAEYDEAAKRLLLEGPQWKVKKGNKTRASVKVQF